MTAQSSDPFAQHMPAVARALLGEPNSHHSKPGRPRWGNKGSLAIDEERGIWKDFEQNVGGGVLALIEREKKLSGAAAIEWLKANGCRINNDAPKQPQTGIRRRIVETYDYVDLDGTLVLQAVRQGFLNPDGNLRLNASGKLDKIFAQRRPMPGTLLQVWIWGSSAGEYMSAGPGHDWRKFTDQGWAKLPATRQRRMFEAAKSIPYRLPELTAAIALGQPVFIVEGEQKVDALATWNLHATCNAGGAGKWPAEHAAHLTNADVVILPDNDDAGRKHTDAVAQTLIGVASRIRVLELPGLDTKGDVVDWQEAGHTREELDALIDRAPDWTAQVRENPATDADKSRKAEQKPTGPSLEVVRASTIKMKAYDWFWPDRFAIGKLGLIVGLPDEGKGQILCYMAARGTRGDEWPCGEGRAPQGDVVILTAEDDPDDTVVPRLASAGADLDRVHIVKMVRDGDKRRMFSLVTDLQLLRQTVTDIGNVKMLQIDPVSAYMGHGKIDSFRTTDVRAVLGPLVDFAAEFNLAIIGILHFNKKVDITNALLRISDSLAFGATARHVYGVVNDQENKRKLFVRAKNNLSSSADRALAYCFSATEVGTDHKTSKTIWAPHIVWQNQYVDVTAAEAMQAATESKSPVARDDAKKFLTDILAGGPVAKRDIEEAAEANGISERTLFRAKADLGISAKKNGLGGGWSWQMPEQPMQKTWGDNS